MATVTIFITKEVKDAEEAKIVVTQLRSESKDSSATITAVYQETLP